MNLQHAAGDAQGSHGSNEESACGGDVRNEVGETKSGEG